MSNFLENIAFRQFENKLPERYEKEPVCCCKNCGGEMYELEDKAKFDDEESMRRIKRIIDNEIELRFERMVELE